MIDPLVGIVVAWPAPGIAYSLSGAQAANNFASPAFIDRKTYQFSCRVTDFPVPPPPIDRVGNAISG